MYILRSEIAVLTGLSLAFAFFDLLTHRVPVWLFAVSVIPGILFCLLGKRDLLTVLAAMVPGLFLTGLSLCTEGGIGIGDGHYLMICALYLSWKETALLTAFAFFLAAAMSLGLIVYGCVSGKSMRKRYLPFLSFMPPALLAVAVLCGRWT